MSDNPFFRLIQSGVDPWNQWRDAHPDAKPDLSRCYLFEANLRGANLQGVIFNRTCLIGADLAHANLMGADLSGAYASGACFTAANLERATLTGANLSDANLAAATLVNVQADGTDFSAVRLSGAYLKNWSMNSATKFERVDCTHVYLRQQGQGRYPQAGDFKLGEFASLIRDNPDISTWAMYSPPDQPSSDDLPQAIAPDRLPPYASRQTADSPSLDQPADASAEPAIAPSSNVIESDIEIAVGSADSLESVPVEKLEEKLEEKPNADQPEQRVVLDRLSPDRSILDPWLDNPQEDEAESPTQIAPPLEPAIASTDHPGVQLSPWHRQLPNRYPSPVITQNQRLGMGLVITAVILAVGAIASLATVGWRAVTRSPQPELAAGLPDFPNLPCDEPPLPDVSAQTPTYSYPNGAQFYGDFADGVPLDGRSTMLFANGDRYDGDYENGQRQGCGTFTFTNGRQYVGQFENDQFEGLGIWTLETGDRYVGEFQANKCNGEGTFLFTDGSTQSGRWQDGTLVDGGLSCSRGAVRLPDSPL